MIIFSLALLLLTHSLAAMKEPAQKKFDETVSKLKSSAISNNHQDNNPLIQDLIAACEKTIKLGKEIEASSDNNEIVKIYTEALQQLKTNPEAFLQQHQELSSTILDNVKVNPDIAQALTTAKEKTKEMQQAWQNYRKLSAYAAQAYLEDKNPGIEFPSHQQGETREEYGKKFISANNGLDSGHDNNYTFQCAGILTLLGLRDEQRKKLFQECDVLNKM